MYEYSMEIDPVKLEKEGSSLNSDCEQIQTLSESRIQALKDKKGLVLEGGGVLGIGHLGVLSRLEELGIRVEQFKYFAGTSAGSIVASALACGGSIEFIINILHELQFENFKDDDCGILRDSYRLWKWFGWHKGKYLEKWAYNTLGAITGNPAITFQEVYEQYGNYLVIPVMKNYETTIYYNKNTTPDMPIFKAIRRSAGIPLFYQADIDETIDSDDDSDKEGDNQYDMYVDGGVLDNFPFHTLEEFLETDQILGLKLMSRTQLHELNHGVHTSPPKNILEAAMKLITALRNQALRLHIKEKHWVNTIKTDVGDMQSTDFGLTLKQKEWLLNQGREAANNFLLPDTVE